MPRIDIHKVYMNIADEIGQLSYAERKKVGCILVKDIDLGEPNNYVNGGHFIQFEEDFVTSGDDGLIKIGFIEGFSPI